MRVDVELSRLCRERTMGMPGNEDVHIVDGISESLLPVHTSAGQRTAAGAVGYHYRVGGILPAVIVRFPKLDLHESHVVPVQMLDVQLGADIVAHAVVGILGAAPLMVPVDATEDTI